jgi:hypothetical protein
LRRLFALRNKRYQRLPVLRKNLIRGFQRECNIVTS